MAEVKMPLEELRVLETTIEDREAEIQQLKGDQRKIIVNHKYFKGRLKGVDRHNRTVVDITVRDDGYDGYMSRYDSGPSSSRYSSQTLSLSDAYKKGLVDIDFTYQEDEVVSKDFVNMDEAKEEIRKDETVKVQTRLDEANDRASNAEYELSKADDKNKKALQNLQDKLNGAEDDNVKKIKDLRKKQKTHLESMAETYNTEKQELQDQIDELTNAKKKKTQESEIKELKAKIKELENRTFWQRVTQ